MFATASSKGLRRVPAAGGEAQVLTKVDPAKGETDHWWPEVLPDGKGVIFTAWNGTAERSRIVALSLSSGPSGNVSDVVRGGSQPHFSPTGHLVYGVGGTLSAVRFNAGSLEAVGNPVPVVEGVAFTPAGAANYALAADGSLLYVKGSATIVGQRTLVWVDRKGNETPIPAQPRAYRHARLSPDGTRIALDVRDEQNDIWVWDLARQTLTRLTFAPGINRGGVWTPDGRRIVFSTASEGSENLYWQNADGSGAPEPLTKTPESQFFPTSFSPDGKQLVFDRSVAPYDIALVTLDGERRIRNLLQTRFNEMSAEISPDGKWLAYQSNESGRSEVYVRPFPDVNTGRWQISTQGGTRPLWARDGRELFYLVAPDIGGQIDQLNAAPIRSGPTFEAGPSRTVFKGSYPVTSDSRMYDVSPDGQRFLLLKDAPAPDGQKPAPPEIHLVQHWAEELKAKVPTK